MQKHMRDLRAQRRQDWVGAAEKVVSGRRHLAAIREARALGRGASRWP